MIRLIFDPLGNGHQDIWLKIDIMPERSFVADSYYLEGSDLKNAVSILLQNWLKKIDEIDNHFFITLPFDISDQYVAGLKLEKVKHGIRVEYVHTEDGELNLSNCQSDGNLNWLITLEQLKDGLKWSLNQL